MSSIGSWALQAILETGQTFLELTIEVLPFFLLGAVTGALLQAFLPEHWAKRLWEGPSLRSLSYAIVAGAILPGCSCTTMPMAEGLRGTGATRLGTVAAFILVSPLLSPMTVALTWGLLGWPMAVARVVASLLGALILGLIINRFEGWFRVGTFWEHPEAPGATAPNPDGCDACEQRSSRPSFWASFWTITRDITPYFLLGMLIAALLGALLPEEAIPRFLGGSSGLWAYALAVVIGIPLYVCEGEEVPITRGLLMVGLGSGPALTFLLSSVGTCIPTVLMCRKVIGQRATGFYLVYWFAFAVTTGLLFEVIWARP